MDYDLNAFAAVMDDGPFETDPTSSDRARITRAANDHLAIRRRGASWGA